MGEAHWGHSPKFGSLGHPFSFTPRGLVSMRKCLTSSLVMSPGKRWECSYNRATPLLLPLCSPTGKPVASPREGSLTLCPPSSFAQGQPQARLSHGVGGPGRLSPFCHAKAQDADVPEPSAAQGRGRLVLLCALGGEGWEGGILPHQHIPKGMTGSADPAACLPQTNDGKYLGVGWRRAHNTFLVLLHDRGRRRSYFHGEAVGSPEGVAVSDDESPRLPVLQQRDGCGREQQTSELAQ